MRLLVCVYVFLRPFLAVLRRCREGYTSCRLTGHSDVTESDVTTNRPTTTTITVKLKIHKTQEDSTKHE